MINFLSFPGQFSPHKQVTWVTSNSTTSICPPDNHLSQPNRAEVSVRFRQKRPPDVWHYGIYFRQMIAFNVADIFFRPTSIDTQKPRHFKKDPCAGPTEAAAVAATVTAAAAAAAPDRIRPLIVPGSAAGQDPQASSL